MLQIADLKQIVGNREIPRLMYRMRVLQRLGELVNIYHMVLT